MSLTHGVIKAAALKVVGDNLFDEAFTEKQKIEAVNDAMNLAARALGDTYLEKDLTVDANGFITLGNEVIVTLKVIAT